MKARFRTGMKPQEADYGDELDSYVHKDELAEAAEALRGPAGQDAKNPFKGRFPAGGTETANLPEGPTVGDYAYVDTVDTGGNPVLKVFDCLSDGIWHDSGRTADPANVNTFADGQQLGLVHIVQDLETGGSGNVLSAEQGKVIRSFLVDSTTYIDFANDFLYATYDYRGTIFKATANSSYVTKGHYYWYKTGAPYNAAYFRIIPVGDSEGSVASIGSTIKMTANGSFGVRYAWLTSVPPNYATGYVEATEILTGTEPIISSANATAIVTVPDGAKYLYVETTGTYNSDTVSRTPSTFVVEENMTGYNVNERMREVEQRMGEKIEEEKSNIQESIVGEFFVEIGLDFPGNVGYIKDNDGTWQWIVGNAQGYRHYIVPCNAGDIFRLTSNGYYGARYAFLTDVPDYNVTYKNITGSTNVANFKFATGYSGLVSSSAGETIPLVAPDDTKCLYIYAGYNPNGHAYTPYKLTKKVSVEDYIKARGTERDILDQYPDAELLPIIRQMSANFQENNSSNIQRTFGCIMFGHITDCHGQDNVQSDDDITAAVSDMYSWERFYRLMSHLKSQNEVGSGLNKAHYVDDIVDTGDIVSQWLQASSGSANDVSMRWRRLGDKEVLTVLGNHDTSAYNKSDGLAYAGTERAYNAFLKDKVDGWGVQQPTNAEENHLCYYAKDYIKGTNKLRALFIDYNDWRAHGSGSDYHQAVWVADQLADALTEGMSVVIFTHDVPGVKSGQNSIKKFAVKSPYTFFSTSSDYEYTDTNYVTLAKLVYDYQQAGGKFIGYVTGHNHNGGIGYIAGRYDNDTFIAPYTQMYYCGAYANVRLREDSTAFSRVLRDPYTKSHDLFRLIAIDVANSIVKILNFGAEYNYRGQRRDIMAIKYNTAQREEFNETRVYADGSIVAYSTVADNKISDCRLYKLDIIETTTISADGNEDTSLPTGWEVKENDPTRWIDPQGNEHYAWVNGTRTVVDWGRCVKTLYDPDVVISD